MNNITDIKSVSQPRPHILIGWLSNFYRVSFAGTLLAGCLTASAQSPPLITAQPLDQTNALSTTATFSVEATGTEPLSYQWQQAYDLYSYLDRPEGTNGTLVIANVGNLDAGNYRVIVSNLGGTVTSSVARLYLALPPLISGQPANFPLVSLGAIVTNRVLAGGLGPLTYQWRHEGTNLDTATSSLLVLTNLGMNDSGRYDVLVTNPLGAVTSRVVTLKIDSTFMKITTGDIVNDTANFVLSSWGDYNGDGFCDLFVSAGWDVNGQAPALYCNEGGTNFVRMTTNEVGVLAASMGSCGQGFWGDFNGDGRLDLLETGWAPGDDSTNRLLLGSTGDTFQFVRDNIGINQMLVSPLESCPVDYNNDGLLDIYFTTGWSDQNYHSRDSLYRNNGDGTFTMVWEPTGPLFNSQYAQWGDYDNDGDMDLWVTGFTTWPSMHSQFYRNDGNGKFTRITTMPNANNFEGAWADFNNDGYLDFVSGDTIYRNNKSGNMSLLSGSIQRAGITLVGDYDNDGDLDIVVGNWGPSPCMFFRNNGLFSFTQVYLGSPSTDGSTNLEAIPSWCDYNNDGFLDLFVTTRGNPKASNRLYCNAGRESGNTNHWLIIKPKGTTSNTSGVGTMVRVLANIRGKDVWQMRQINGSIRDELRAHFGLGNATNITTLRIEWPLGTVQELANVPMDQILNITEPRRPKLTLQISPSKIDGQLVADPNQAYEMHVSEDLKNWTLLNTLTTGAEGAAAWSDPNVVQSGARFYKVNRK